MKSHPHRLCSIAIVLACGAALVGGLALETTLAHATTKARATLPETLARAPHETGGEVDDGALLEDATRLARRRDYAGAAAILAIRTENTPSSASHSLAARGAAAAGRFDEAARHAAFAARLAPADDGAVEVAQHQVDLTLLHRVRPATRVLAGVGAVLLFAVLWGARRRARRGRRLAAWLDGLESRMTVLVDGQRMSGDRTFVVRPDAASVAVDLFLRAGGACRRPPRPGPTLSLVLSHAASNLTLRLTPRRDVRDDAVRIRFRDETLARLLARAGTWRLVARLDGQRVGEASIEVAPRAPERAARRLHLVERV